jgi:fructose-bisphosphate aldolase, class II
MKGGVKAMPLSSVKNILKLCDDRNYGAAAFVCFNHESIKWSIESAEELNMPVIIMLYPGMSNIMPFSSFAAITKALAADARIPVGLHLDHCTSYEVILKSISCGFTSVMVDGSAFDFEKNVQMTSEIVRAAHAMGVDVEAELGHVGAASKAEDFMNKSAFTDPDEAKEFVKRTGVDSLAVAFGNAHGNYVSTPTLDIKLLSKLDAAVEVPLVLHGGTGIPDDQIKEAVRHGIRKMNVGTILFNTYQSTIEEYMKSEGDKNVFKFIAYEEKVMKAALKGRIESLVP